MIILQKILNRISYEKNRLWKYFNVERLSMIGYKGSDASSADFLKTRLLMMLGRYDVSLLEGISKIDRDLILSSSERVLRHEFALLGSLPVKLDPINWHIDFKSGIQWGKGFYRELLTPKGADIKVPWELSRCQHLLWLGEAWLLTNERRYAQGIIDEINWWTEDNPLMYTVNWKCAMDVAFRAVNWIFALNMISDYAGFDDVFAARVSKSLWQHGFFISNNLEKQIPYSNNHYTSELVGLLYIGAVFIHTRKGNNWKRFAYKELMTEIMIQVLPSGVHYERSVSYHRLMTEMLSYPVYMLKRIGEPVHDEVLNRLQAMYSYIANYTKPNGYAPLVGDNDDGRFVPFLCRDFREHNYLNDPESVENRVISAGLKPLFCTSEVENKLYEDTRVAIIHEQSNYLFVNNGGYSKRPSENQVRIGTHTHNDLLSFEFVLDGKDIIVDAGTYLYTSSQKDRDAFRSTAKHNTVVVDEEEQNGFPAPFSMTRNVIIGNLRQKSDNAFLGDYTTIQGQMNHHRLFELKEGCLCITDTIIKAGIGHIARLYLHFAEGLKPFISDDMVRINSKATVAFDRKPAYLEVIDDTLSPSFGVLQKSRTVVASYEFENELKIITRIKRNG